MGIVLEHGTEIASQLTVTDIQTCDTVISKKKY